MLINPKGKDVGRWRVFRGASWSRKTRHCCCVIRKCDCPYIVDSVFIMSFRVVMGF